MVVSAWNITAIGRANQIVIHQQKDSNIFLFFFHRAVDNEDGILVLTCKSFYIDLFNSQTDLK